MSRLSDWLECGSYSMNANLILKWLKDPRFPPATGETPDAPEGGRVFLPVEIPGSTIDQRVEDVAVPRTETRLALGEPEHEAREPKI